MPAVTNTTLNPLYGECNLSAGSTWQPLATGNFYKCSRIMVSAPTAGLSNVNKNNSGGILIKVGQLNASTGLYNAPSGATAQMGGFVLQTTQNGITYVLAPSPMAVFAYGTAGDCVEFSAD